MGMTDLMTAAIADADPAVLKEMIRSKKSVFDLFDLPALAGVADKMNLRVTKEELEEFKTYLAKPKTIIVRVHEYNPEIAKILASADGYSWLKENIETAKRKIKAVPKLRKLMGYAG
ncbi:MAG: hypothetical protein M0R66_07655 [Candidatus Omnitrophica bacterium]|nr:hypothetical protein [Candidatus Omnitrophota bacterium]